MSQGNGIILLPEDALPAVEELSGDLRMLAEIVTVEKALEVAQVFGGTSIRCYGVQKWIRRWRDRMIRKDSEHMSGIELARKYNLSERQIWNILGSPEPDERQMELF
ncbi:Mor transcription activator family protein [Thermodesulfobacteriota bacterium]